MRIFLQERLTHLYLKPSGRWEATRRGALEFPTGTEAMARASAFVTLDVQVVFHAEDPRDSFAVRTGNDFARPAA